MNAYIKMNLSKKRYSRTANDIINKLKSENYVNLIFSGEDTKLFGDNKGLTIADADMVISIGGDGTLLQASKIALAHNIPIVGINGGRAGMLCKFTLDDILTAKENPFKDMNVSARDVLSLTYKKQKFLALNDFVFASRNAGYTIVTNVKTKNRDISYHASGVIISTPTGSSAYNAAACRCLIDPQLPVNIISPICARGQDIDSFVVANNEDIIVSNMRADDPIDIYCDGIYVGSLEEELVIKKNSRKLKLVI